jgi:hypothetical protein
MKAIGRRLRSGCGQPFGRQPHLTRQRGNRIREALAAAGFVAGPVESLAEVCARAMGITCLELRSQLERRAAGLPVSCASLRLG